MVEIDFKFPDWAELIRTKEKELMLFMAAQIQFNRGMLFDKEGAHNGRSRWTDLSFRRGQILSKRGTLRKSIAPIRADGTPGPDGIVRMAGDTIFVGTKMLNARMMNDGTTKMPGGVLRPVRAKALKIPLPQGKSAGEGAKDIQRQARRKKLAKLQEQSKELQSRKNEKGVNLRLMKIFERIKREEEAIREGKGPVKFIFRKSVKIPARPFDDWNQQDQIEFDAALLGKLQELLRRGA